MAVTRTSNRPTIVAVAADGSPINLDTGIPWSAITDFPPTIREAFPDADAVFKTDRLQDPALIQSLSSFKIDGPVVDIRKFGANANGVNQDTDAFKRALNSGASEIWFPPGYTFLLDNPNNTYATYPVAIPDGVRLRFDGVIRSTVGKSISMVADGDLTVYGNGKIWMEQGQDNHLFQVKYGVHRFLGLRFRGGSTTSNPIAIYVPNPTTGSIDDLLIAGCSTENYMGGLYMREQSAGRSHVVRNTKIIGCKMRDLWNGCGILINAIAGVDEVIDISEIQINGCKGDSNGNANAGFGIAIAGQTGNPFAIGGAVGRSRVSNCHIKAARTGVHLEYTSNAEVDNVTVEDVNAAYYPTGTESSGIVVYSSMRPVIRNCTVRDVTGDGIYAEGIRLIGENLNAKVKDNHTFNASYRIEQPIRVVTLNGITSPELSPSSVCDFSGNTSDNGMARVYGQGTLHVRKNTLTAPHYIGPFTVTNKARASSVVTLTLSTQNALVGFEVGDLIAITGVGTGFDSQPVSVLSIVNYGSTAAITYTGFGGDVASVASSGSVYWVPKALVVDASDSRYESNFASDLRLAIDIAGNQAEDQFGQSSFDLRGVATNRLGGNVRLTSGQNNFPVVAGVSNVVAANRTLTTTSASPDLGFEYAQGDLILLQSGTTRQKCTASGYAAPSGARYSIVTANAGLIQKAAGSDSWVAATPAFVLGQMVRLVADTTFNNIYARVRSVANNAGNQQIVLVDPVTGAVLDLTAQGGPGTIAPATVATFVAA